MGLVSALNELYFKKDENMKNLFLIMVLCIANCAFASEILNFPYLVASGSAEIKVAPDSAKISFSVTEFSKDAKEAGIKVFKQGQAVLAIAKELGIPKEQVTSSEYTKRTKRKRDDHYNDLDILGYDVSQDYVIEIKKIEQYTLLADQLLKLGNIENIRTSFDVSNRQAIESDLTKQATKDARKKANDLADGMGVKIISVHALSQDFSLSAYQAIFGVREYQGANMSPPEFVAPPALDFVPDSAASNMFVPKTIEISKSVNVVFKIK